MQESLPLALQNALAVSSVDEEPLPYVEPALLERLERQFPDKSPRLGTPPEEVWHMAGQASVVEWIRSVQAAQEQA